MWQRAHHFFAKALGALVRSPGLYVLLQREGLVKPTSLYPMKYLWELSKEELDEEIKIAKAMLESGGYNKMVADHLAALQGQREERDIEDRYP